MRNQLIRPLFLGLILALPLLLRTAAPFPTWAEEPAHYTFSPAPPGIVTQSVLFYPVGQAMHSQWRAVASKKLVGTSGHDSFYQWYLSVYSINGEATYNLQYQSPGTDNFLSVVKKYASSLWLPSQTLKIDGVVQLMHPAVDNLVVEQHEASADCGGGNVSVFYYDWTRQKIEKSISVSNGCELHAKVIHDKLGDAIQLTGPYYGPNAPMCCPTKNNATAILRYTNGKWTMKPNYFTVSASLSTHGN